MKKLILLLSFVLLVIISFAQTPAKNKFDKPGVNSKFAVIVTSADINVLQNVSRDSLLELRLNDRFHKNNSENMFVNVYRKGYVDSLQVTPYTGGIVETKTRVTTQNRTTTGTTRAVPGTYATLTAAYTAAVNGDIILVAAGTYEMSAESGGYWLVNTSTKGVIVRGATGNPADVIFNHTSNATYGIRLRDCLDMQFENITFQSSGTFAPFIMEQAYASNFVKFKNCILNQTSGGASGVFGRTSLTSDTDVIWVEFENCVIASNGTITPIQYTVSGVNETFRMEACTVTTTGLTGIASTISYKSDHKGTLCLYDCTFNSSVNNIIIQVGEDETVPTNTTFKTDIRNCSIAYTGAAYNHAVLLGRGTNKVYCVNNNIYIPSTSNTLAIGMVIKTAATAVNDSYIAGNNILAPRPFYIKGGQNNIIKFNICETNYPTSYFGLDIANPEAIRISSGNVVRFNNFYGGLAAIGTYDSASWEDPETTIQGWNINNNRYYSTNGTWANISGSSKAFSVKRTIYLNSNDVYSKMITSKIINISTSNIYDNTSTISW